MASRRGKAQQNETVRGEYASGTGWEAGMRAPSTKYVDMDGKVSDSEPEGGGHVLVAEGDTVRQHMLDVINGDANGSTEAARLDNENSPGDNSNQS